MASIRCQWGHVHATVAEVRACADAARGGDDGSPPDPVAAAGPEWLGRDAIVAPGQAVPDPWAAAPVVKTSL